MRTVLGAAAIFIGIPLVCGGIFGIIGGVGMLGNEPQFGEPLLGMGLSAMLFGSLLCSTAWMWTNLDDKK